MVLLFQEVRVVKMRRFRNIFVNLKLMKSKIWKV